MSNEQNNPADTKLANGPDENGMVWDGNTWIKPGLPVHPGAVNDGPPVYTGPTDPAGLPTHPGAVNDGPPVYTGPTDPAGLPTHPGPTEGDAP